MKNKSAVIERFNEGPVIREFEISAPEQGEVLVRLEASGVCGSDLHILQGRDPRIRIPMIPGHEGAGIVAGFRGRLRDIEGNILAEGDRIVWDRGVYCGRCCYCVIRKQPYLCPYRKVYGITFNIYDNPFPNGCYSEFIKLSPATNYIKVSKKLNPAVLAPAGCSGATAYHAVESASIKPGDNVLIQGPGPLGIFAAAFCKERGAENIIMVGSSKSRKRMELSMHFGVSHIIYRDKMTEVEQAEDVACIVGPMGVDHVFEMAGTSSAVEAGQNFVCAGGNYIIAGVSVPVGNAGIKIYENIVRKNASIKGVWVSDTSHLAGSVRVVESGRYPFEKIINKTFPLSEADDAIQSVNDRDIIKSVIIP